MADKPVQSADDNVIMNRSSLVYETISSGGGQGIPTRYTTNLKVIYAVNKVTGEVTLYENRKNLGGIGPFDADLRNLNTGDLTPLATWQSDPNNPEKGRWVASDPTKKYGDNGLAGTWEQLSKNKLKPPDGVSNEEALSNQITKEINETGLLTDEQKTDTDFPGTNTSVVSPGAGAGDGDEGGDGDGGDDGTNPEQPERPAEPLNIDVTTITQINTLGEWGSLRNYKYPAALPPEVSDIIQFQIVDYRTQAQRGEGISGQIKSLNNVTDLGRGATTALQADTKGTISLAIQPPITDSNGVNWTDSGINLVQLAAAGLSAGFIEGGFSGMFQSFQDIEGLVANDNQAVKTALKIYFAQQASQTSGLNSRLTGSVLNPNLETLFEGPRTRTFTYRFQFTPRDDKEAVEVRSIIRTFKEAMSVKRTSGQTFLKAPYVFNIRYLYKNSDNPYIGRVKGPCALKDMQTDYTPQGTYMSFDSENEGDGSMIAYNVTLVFQELDPIYFDDYTGLGDISNGKAGSIGY